MYKINTSRGLEVELSNELSGTICQRWTGDLAAIHRECATPGHMRAAKYVFEKAKEIGLEDVLFKEYAADGRTKFWAYTANLFWVPKEGILKVVDPEERIIADFSEIPCVLAIRSGSTPPEGVTAELVYVGKGVRDEDYKDKDVRGKLVLADPDGQQGDIAASLAKEKGALGIILENLIEYPPKVTRIDRPDAIGHAWITRIGAWKTKDHSKEIFGFSISYRQGLYLKRLLEEGPVKVYAKVDTEFREGTMPLITGVIKGSIRPEEEIALLAHLDHPWPGANDNASGCAVLLEIARVLQKLIQMGKIDKPKRTIRFMWVPHIIGTVAWLHENPDWPKRVLAALVADHVGSDQQKCGCPLTISLNPASLPSYLDDLVDHFLERIPSEGRTYSENIMQVGALVSSVWKYERTTYHGGSEHQALVDRSIKVPAVCFSHWPDLFYHTHQDSVDKTDPKEFEKVGWVMSMVAMNIADAGATVATVIANEVAIRGKRRLDEEARKTIWRMMETAKISRKKGKIEGEYTLVQPVAEAAKKGLKKMNFILDRERKAVESAKRLFIEGEKEMESTIVTLINGLEGEKNWLEDKVLRVAEVIGGKEVKETAKKERELSEIEKSAARMIPVRKYEGVFVFYELEDALGIEVTKWFSKLREPEKPIQRIKVLMDRGSLLWVDGKRSILEIAQALEYEYDFEPNINIILEFFDKMKKAGFIELKKS